MSPTAAFSFPPRRPQPLPTAGRSRSGRALTLATLSWRAEQRRCGRFSWLLLPRERPGPAPASDGSAFGTGFLPAQLRVRSGERRNKTLQPCELCPGAGCAFCSLRAAGYAEIPLPRSSLAHWFFFKGFFSPCALRGIAARAGYGSRSTALRISGSISVVPVSSFPHYPRVRSKHNHRTEIPLL